ncbi:M20 family metallopeptidase [Bacillus marinisedimentorum]|uniref:M20 family metallopeptidase n=1 Tax=Bacillus marinisedimentorum TaxID=1821260 RepID=UPI0007E015F2|nr:M20 family metallopeptidase [Bacillus marinisedimentorum]
MEAVFKHIDEEEAVSFLQSLVQINSVNPPGNEKKVAETIQAFVQSTGLLAELDDLGDNRANLMISYPHGKNDGKHLVYSGHFDTVPTGKVEWEHDPFSGKLVDGKVFGRGTTDMKGGVAAMVLAMKYLEQAGIKLGGKLQFAGTAGEEVDGYGAKQMVKKGQLDTATAMAISEPSTNELFTAHKGCLWLEISVYGKTAHGSMPELGVNAITVMGKIMEKLEQYEFSYDPHPLLGHPTMNVGTIAGGVKTNVVADECTLTLDIRTVPGQDHEDVLREMTELVESAAGERGGKSDIRIVNDMPPVSTDAGDDFVRTAIRTGEKHVNRKLSAKGVNYYTDASVFWPHLQIPVVINGPGRQELAHQPNETVEVKLFIESIRYYMALAVEYLSVED